MHISDKDAGQISPPQAQHPVQQPRRATEAKFRILLQLVAELDDWLTTHENGAFDRYDLGFRIGMTEKMYKSYLDLLFKEADESHLDLTKEFRDRFFAVLGRAQSVLERAPQGA